MTQAEVHLKVISGLGAQTDAQRGPARILQLDQRTYDRALACVHCGLCLPACPTYTQNGLEADSPRGRIYLMKGLADGKIEPTLSVLRHLDLCLDCRACETACPSGVVYHELIEETRTRLADQRQPGLVDRLIRFLFFEIFPHPRRLKLALLPAVLLQKLGLWPLLAGKTFQRLLPPQLQKMQQMLPRRGLSFWERGLAKRYPGNSAQYLNGKPRATVGLLAGCVSSVLCQSLNRQTIALLRHTGCDVLVPPAQRCCGAIHHHGGKMEQARDYARANIDAFIPADGRDARVDHIVCNVAGCGASLREYDHLLRDDPRYAARAKDFSQRYRDISELLVLLNPPHPQRSLPLTVTYHDACHLAHAQKVVDPPRRILGWIEGLKLIPLPESEICCGAAGTYNLSEPHMARALAERKIRNIQSTGARICVTGNIGCAMQIQSEADRLGVELRVVHPVNLLHQAYFGDTNGA